MQMQISTNKLVDAVSGYYGISSFKLQKKSRKLKFSKPRQIAMFLLKEKLNKSYPYIARVFKKKDHTTVIYAHQKISEEMRNSAKLRFEIEQILRSLNGQIPVQKNNKVSHDAKEQLMVAQNKISNNKRGRFKKLAAYRTNEILKKLKILGNCSNRSAYDYKQEDIRKIFAEIERRTKEIKAKFHYPKNKEFKL